MLLDQQTHRSLKHPPAAPDAASSPSAQQGQLAVDHRQPTRATQQGVSQPSLLLPAGVVAGVLGMPAMSAGYRTPTVCSQEHAASTLAGGTAPPAPPAAKMLSRPGHFDRHRALEPSEVVAAGDGAEPEVLDPFRSQCGGDERAASLREEPRGVDADEVLHEART